MSVPMPVYCTLELITNVQAVFGPGADEVKELMAQRSQALESSLAELSGMLAAKAG